MTPLPMFVIAFAVIFGGALAGSFLRGVLPGHHLTADTKDVMRLGSTLLAWIAALVLGLLIASAHTAFETQSNHVQRLTANLILLDALLAQYGPETQEARTSLRRAVEPLVARIWRENNSEAAMRSPFQGGTEGEAAFAAVERLSPQTDAQRSLKARAVEVATGLAQTRLLLFENAGSAIPLPFLMMLIVWLAIIFANFSMFCSPNPTLIVALAVFALSASSAIYLILELSEPFAGLMQISSVPLRNALAPLAP